MTHVGMRALGAPVELGDLVSIGPVDGADDEPATCGD